MHVLLKLISCKEKYHKSLWDCLLWVTQDANDEDVALFDSEEDAGKRSKTKIRFVYRYLLIDCFICDSWSSF